MAKRWHVDDLVIHKIVEEERAYNTIDRFLPNLGAERLAANLDWFTGNGYVPEARTVSLSYHCYLVETPAHKILIDTCIGNDKTIPVRDSWNRRHDTRWLNEFAATGVAFEDIDYVLCTHLHADRVGWNTRREDGKWHRSSPMPGTCSSAPSTSSPAPGPAPTPRATPWHLSTRHPSPRA
jgi:hypothetical protein